MDLIIQILLPICLYLIYNFLDSLHTLSTLRPPGVSHIDKLGPVQNEVFAVENNLDFLRTGKLKRTLGRDLFFDDWHWPSSGWKWSYTVNDGFMKEYLNNKKRWWGSKVIGTILLITLVSIFVFFARLIFPEPHNYFTFCMTASFGLIFSIVLWRFLARLLYRFLLLLKVHWDIFWSLPNNIVKFGKIRIKEEFLKDDDAIKDVSTISQFAPSVFAEVKNKKQ